VIVLVSLLAFAAAEKVVSEADCAFHVKMGYQPNSVVFDAYVMMNGTETIYMRTRQEDSEYVIRGDMKNVNGSFYVLNGTKCEEGYGAEGFDYVQEFEYNQGPTTVECPDGIGYCTQYCNVGESTKCLVLDYRNRVVKSEHGETMYFTYEDDVPTLDTFAVKLCNGAMLNAPPEVCHERTLPLNMGCSFHAKVITQGDESYQDYYGMMNGTELIYVHSEIHSPEKNYYAIIRFDMKKDNGDYFVITNESGTCDESYTKIEGLFTEFVYDQDPVNVVCPDNKTVCKKYCKSKGFCIVVDENGRMVEIPDERYSIYYTWFDDKPGADMFVVHLCAGSTVSAQDFCSAPTPSPTPTPGSTPADASTSKASFITIMFAILIAILL